MSEGEGSRKLRLAGCAPTPLAAYLKGLGILRLLAEQKDSSARGAWKDEVFVIETGLTRDQLVAYFLNEYRPTPIISPWNGGSGFFPGDAKDAVEALASAQAPRFADYRAAVAHGTSALQKLQIRQKPSKEVKPILLSELRSTMPDRALGWFDASVVLTTSGPSFPPLLGTGGNDGRLEFSNNHMQRLIALFDPESGSPTEKAHAHISGALFGTPVSGLGSGAIGQFSPGAAGGANASTGFGGEPLLTAWDYVLMLEGALLFGAAAVRRLEMKDPAVMVAPFTVRPAGCGSGAADFADEETARAEFWAPLWERFATLTEVQTVLREGRATVGRRPARHGLDFVRAAASLGVQRGIHSFERFGFLMRSGRTYFATPLGRVKVERNPDADLIDELDRGRWLDRVRRLAREDRAPARLRNLGRTLEDAIFDMARRRTDSLAVQRVLSALGAIAIQLPISEARKPEDERIPPPPPLSGRWIERADDQSTAFRIAAALASIGARRAELSDDAGNTDIGDPTDDQAVDVEPEGMTAAIRSSKRRRLWLPIACHLAPLQEARLNPDRGRPGFAYATSSSLHVWGPGGLTRNLAAVAERRLLEGDRRGLADKPLAGYFGLQAQLDDVLAFLADDADDPRIAALVQGLAWVDFGPRHDDHRQPAVRLQRPDRAERPLPFAYALLKPLFVTDRALRVRLFEGAAPPLAPSQSLPIPADLMRLLAGNSWRRAFAAAKRRLRASGLSSPFGVEDAVLPFDVQRLVAALLIPIDRSGLARVLERVVPDIAERDSRGDVHAA